MMYVSLCDAKKHCRVDHDEDDVDLTLKIQAASSMVKNYIKDTSPYEPARDGEDNPREDSNGEPLTDADLYSIRYEVQAATLILTQKMYDQTLDSEPGYMPKDVQALLYPLPVPTIA